MQAGEQPGSEGSPWEDQRIRRVRFSHLIRILEIVKGGASESSGVFVNPSQADLEVPRRVPSTVSVMACNVERAVRI